MTNRTKLLWIAVFFFFSSVAWQWTHLGSSGELRLFQALASSSKNLISHNTPSTPRGQVLHDPLGRIPEAFDIPSSLSERVHFWFDIYTLYSANEYVIHHADMPWLILKVLNVTPILTGPGKREIGRAMMAEKFVASEFSRIVTRLKLLSKRKHKRALAPEESAWLELLHRLPGKYQANLKAASDKIRIQRGQRDFMLEAINTSSRYLHHMEQIFESNGLPPELTRLPLVESSFNLSAVSKVGAAGVWQIMPDLGKRFLIVDTLVDERRSPGKATAVAARILKENKMILKEWPLAVTAYNHGPGGVLRASRLHGTRDLGKIITKHQRGAFGFATSNFYSEFLAALYAEKYKDKVFRQELLQDERVETESLFVRGRMSLGKLAKRLGIDKTLLAELNPDLTPKFISSGHFLPKGYELSILKGLGERLRPHMALNPSAKNGI